VYYRNYVYLHVTGWHSLEPWLGRIEKCRPEVIEEIAGNIPPEWYGGDWDALRSLVQAIIARRMKVRDLIAAFRDSSRNPFPAWGQEVSESAAHAYVM